jgi:thymidylate kinase
LSVSALGQVSPDVTSLLASLMGDHVVILHRPMLEETSLGLGGRDVDCAVVGLDPLWPLRLPDGWRLCECLHYDLRGWYWVVEKDGEVVALDTVDDPKGLGRDGFPTVLFAEHGPLEASPAARAAYLTVKRLRKGVTSHAEWGRIGRLAREDPQEYLKTFTSVSGPNLDQIAHAALEGIPPDPTAFRRARRQRLLRRFGTPARALTAVYFGARRYVKRIRQPTGLLVVVAGPDGSGKSTLADALPGLCRGIFKREARFHWRPGLLPRVGAFLRTEQGDTTRPHAHPPHGRAVSLMVLFYYWLDFLIGDWVRIWPLRIRAGLVILERGWWDISVDPRRYRLQVSDRAVRVLGSFLRQPDLVVVLGAEPRVLLERKAEIEEGELARQTSAWTTVLPTGVRRVSLDASLPARTVEREARETIVRLMEARAVSRLGAGWLSLRRRSSNRWSIPRGPRAAARRGLGVYQPVTAKGRIGWEAARIIAGIGGFHLLPRGTAPPREVREVLASHLPPKATMAVSRANHPGRYVALVTTEDGTSGMVAKIATDPEGERALFNEAASIDALGPLLHAPLSPPRLLVREPGLLLFESAPWRARWAPWRMDEEVAAALGTFFRSGARKEGKLRGPAHGDCAPWNLLRTSDGWVLVDWEDASPDRPPFYDLWHYLVQSHALLGRPSARDVIEGVHGRGWVGRLVLAYGEAAGVPVAQAGTLLISYLQLSRGNLTATTRREREGLAARDRLLASLRTP